MQRLELFEMSSDLNFASKGEVAEQYRIQKAVVTLRLNGVEVYRYNFLQNPTAFLGNETIGRILETDGDAGFPVTLIDGKMLTKGRYPSGTELAETFSLSSDILPDTYPAEDVELWFKMMMEAERGGCGAGSCSGCSGCGSVSDPDHYSDFDSDQTDSDLSDYD